MILFLKGIQVILFWIVYFLAMTGMILYTGTLLFTIAFFMLGPFFGATDPHLLMIKGASVGFRYTGVWVGGIAIVLCFIKAHRMKLYGAH